MVNIKNKDGNYVKYLTMVDSGSNTSFISKNVAKKLEIRVRKTPLSMNLLGGQKKSEDLTVTSTVEQNAQKSYAINTPTNPARTVS